MPPKEDVREGGSEIWVDNVRDWMWSEEAGEDSDDIN